MKHGLLRYFLSGALLLFLGCSKTPETLLSPSVKIEPDKTTQGYVLFFTAGLKNENDSVAFLNFTGTANIIDNEKKTVLSIPFDMPVILPFETGVIKKAINLSESEATSIFKLLNIDKEKLSAESEEGTKFIDEKNISLQIQGFSKEDIVQFLKKKVKGNAENK